MIKELDCMVKAGINEETIKLYEKYYKSCIVRNKFTKETTYKTYIACSKLFFEFILNFQEDYHLFRW